MPNQSLLFGCIADDFTGAGDAASFLAAAGMETMLFAGIPDSFPEEMPRAAVIALKTRTAPREEAVRQTLKAAHWLRESGAERLYLKYCSTFDSTPEGNIGPTADALLEEFHLPYTLLCPALPINGRTVRDGRLLVDGTPLHNSPMKNHPLTPMWDDRIRVLMEAQSRYPAYPLSIQALRSGHIPHHTGDRHFYLIPDYYEPEHGAEIVKQFGNLGLLTGGSGLLTALADTYIKKYSQPEKTFPVNACLGEAVMLAGSCSQATLGQIEYYQKHGGISYKIRPDSILNEKQALDEITDFLCVHKDRDVLIYSSGNAEVVRQFREYGKGRASEVLEHLMARIAVRGADLGRSRIIVAGGETSGAVTKALGCCSYYIGKSIAPGVPVMIPKEASHIRLVLKSGNFGPVDFFERAAKMTKGAENGF